MERIYGIYDIKAEALVHAGIKLVMIYANDAVARRDFAEIVQGKPFQQHPDDYVLYRFATIEGLSIQPEIPQIVMRATEAMQQDPKQLDLTDERIAAKKENPRAGAPTSAVLPKKPGSTTAAGE